MRQTRLLGENLKLEVQSGSFIAPPLIPILFSSKIVTGRCRVTLESVDGGISNSFIRVGYKRARELAHWKCIEDDIDLSMM
jgi:hypothetical protein